MAHLVGYNPQKVRRRSPNAPFARMEMLTAEPPRLRFGLPAHATRRVLARKIIACPREPAHFQLHLECSLNVIVRLASAMHRPKRVEGPQGGKA